MSSRKRIGLMVPSTNTTCEADFQMAVPRGITVHGQRLWLTNEGTGHEVFNRMNAEIEAGARYLATAKVDVIVYGCTTGSFFKGPGWDREMCDVIQRAAGVPAVATSPSVVEALRAFGARRISVATPYPDWNNDEAARVSRSPRLSGAERRGRAARRCLGQPGHQRSGPGVGGRVRLAGVPAGGRRAPLLVHRVAIRRGRGRD